MSESSGSAEDDFESFVRSTGTRLYRTAYLLTGDHHLAEDLTQITYAKVFARWSRLVRAESPVAYARTTLVNTYLSHRRLRRNSELPVEPAAEAAQHATDSSEEWSVRLDLIAALNTLKAIDRAVIAARYWDDRSVAETARELGLTEAVVRARSRRALQRLRALVPDLLHERTPL